MALHLTEADLRSPDLIIGADYYWDFILGPSEKLPSGFFKLETTIGPVICGKGKISFKHNQISDETSYSATNIQLNENGTEDQLWKLETLGVMDNPNSEEDLALQLFLKSIRWDAEQNRYFVKWPWRVKLPTSVQLDPNYGLALGCLTSVLRKLSPELKEAYAKIFAEQLAAQIIEDAPKTPEVRYLLYAPSHSR